MTEEVVRPKMPKRLYFRLINNGKRLKFYFKEDMGGAYLSYSDLMEAVQHRGMYEGYADFVEDSPEWVSRTKGQGLIPEKKRESIEE